MSLTKKKIKELQKEAMQISKYWSTNDADNFIIKLLLEVIQLLNQISKGKV